MTDVESSMRVRRAESSAGQALGKDDFLVLDLDSGRYFSVGKTGGLIWNRLDGESTLAELAAEISQRYGIELERARTDILAFAHDLIASGLAEIVPVTNS